MSPASPDVLIPASGLFFAVFSLFRFSFNLGILERPLFIGFVWALATGDYTTTLGAAVFFELFWLDQFPAGTHIPPHYVAATSTAFYLNTVFGLTAPADVLLAALLGLPPALAGAKLEGLLRELQNKNYSRLVQEARNTSGGFFPGRIVTWSVVVTFAASFLFFCLAMALLTWLLPYMLPLWRSAFADSGLSWAHLWIAASAGGILSIRFRRAYGLLLCGVVIVAMSGFFGVGAI